MHFEERFVIATRQERFDGDFTDIDYLAVRHQ